MNIKIRGISPLLMNRFLLEPVPGLQKMTAEEQAEIAAYRTEGGELFIPGINMQRALISGAKYSKGKGRASLQSVAAACLLITAEQLPLGCRKFTVDSRSVVVPATKGRIVRHRPRLNEWTLNFELEYDPELLSREQVETIVRDTGRRVGLGDFRPENKGMFGRFDVIEI
ncbi:MAG: hypothetical protein WC959_05560 [Kiritimatiellales bacterium]